MRDQNIFGSGVERASFVSLRRKWEQEVDVFPQLPVKPVVGFMQWPWYFLRILRLIRSCPPPQRSGTREPYLRNAFRKSLSLSS